MQCLRPRHAVRMSRLEALKGRQRTLRKGSAVGAEGAGEGMEVEGEGMHRCLPPLTHARRHLQLTCPAMSCRASSYRSMTLTSACPANFCHCPDVAAHDLQRLGDGACRRP